MRPNEDDFCVVHGRDHMKADRGPIAYCVACDIDNNHRNAILESAALVAEHVDNCQSSTYDNGGTEDGHRQAKSQIADAIRALKLNHTPYTPGPWEVKRAHCDPKEWAIMRKGAVSIAGASDGRPGRPVVAHAVGLNSEADARLIAAAPDLLAALEAVEEWWLREGMSHFTGAPYAIFATRAAVAKAKTPVSR